MAETNTGPVTPQELLAIAEGAPPEIAGRIRRAADQLAATECPPTGAGRIYAERMRHVREEGFHPVVDDCYRSQQLANAAACYIIPASGIHRIDAALRDDVPKMWPWSRNAWKPGRVLDVQAWSMAIHDRVRELEKGGALAAAEIDRLLRLQATGATTI